MNTMGTTTANAPPPLFIPKNLQLMICLLF
jgi:hypothetical protein